LYRSTYTSLANICPEIPHLDNDALLSHTDGLLYPSPSSGTISVASDTDAPDTVYTGGDCTLDPYILWDTRQMLLEIWNISEPREWQLKAIYLMAYGRVRELRQLPLVWPTGDGKLLVIYGLVIF
jgi:hypothetical protein